MENKPWLSQYPPGIPANIDINKYENMVDFIDECIEKFGDLPAYENLGKRLTYKQIGNMSDHFGAYLHSRGLVPGDKIALMMPNLLQFPIALFGCLKAGLTVVNTNPLYTPREMKHQFVDSDVKAIVIADNFAANLQKVLGETSINTIILTSIGEMLGSIKGSLVNFVVKKVKRMVPKYDLPNTVTFSEALKTGKKFKINSFENKPENVIVHQYTGGTTGVAKGAMLTNRNLVANMLQIQAWLGNGIEEGKEIVLTPLPLYHIFAFTVNCMAMMSYGALNVLVTNPRDLPKFIGEFKKNKITIFTGVNTLFNALIHNKTFQDLDFSSLKIVVGGGMAVQTAVAQKWKAITGTTLSEGYGLTEASPVVTTNPIDGSARIGSIGVPIPSTDVRIVGENGSVLKSGEVGELQVKGPQVMKGYYNKYQETEDMFSDGWLCTGDIATMDPDGYFRIVDRKKDMILVSGFNVFPNEIEDVIAQHPKVSEVAAIGVPDEKSGEVVKVFVVKEDKSLTKEELIAYCRENCTAYKVPKQVEFRDDLPKSNVGKILRRMLKEEG
ncbi:MAG: AMP-binding protein [Saprospiraceae bacterium]|nr:AMP-binding protein [Saprospiraceae bacterium]